MEQDNEHQTAVRNEIVPEYKPIHRRVRTAITELKKKKVPGPDSKQAEMT